MKLLGTLRVPESTPMQLLAHITARKFAAVAKLFAEDAHFQAWTPSGHWSATGGRGAAGIIELWFTPGRNSTLNFTRVVSAGRGVAVIECEIAWGVPVQINSKMTQAPADEPRLLRQVYVMRVKDGRIHEARVYCAGLHTTFPDVDVEKVRRAKSLLPRPSAGKASNNGSGASATR